MVLFRPNRDSVDYLVLGDSYLLVEVEATTYCLTDLRLKAFARETRSRRRRMLEHSDFEVVSGVARQLALEE